MIIFRHPLRRGEEFLWPDVRRPAANVLEKMSEGYVCQHIRTEMLQRHISLRTAPPEAVVRS